MILVDTSVWADHLRSSDAELSELLVMGKVLAHPYVIEELACGHLPNRSEFLARIHALPQAPIAMHEEVLEVISNNRLYGTGLGAIDVHIIASAMLGQVKIWSRDKALIRESTRLNLAA